MRFSCFLLASLLGRWIVLLFLCFCVVIVVSVFLGFFVSLFGGFFVLLFLCFFVDLLQCVIGFIASVVLCSFVSSFVVLLFLVPFLPGDSATTSKLLPANNVLNLVPRAPPEATQLQKKDPSYSPRGSATAEICIEAYPPEALRLQKKYLSYENGSTANAKDALKLFTGGSATVKYE